MLIHTLVGRGLCAPGAGVTLARGTMAWAPLGRLLGGKNHGVSMVLERLSVSYGVPPEVLLLAWLQKHPAGIVPVVGTTKPERYGLLVKSAGVSMELEHWFELLEASRGHKVP